MDDPMMYQFEAYQLQSAEEHIENLELIVKDLSNEIQTALLFMKENGWDCYDGSDPEYHLRESFKKAMEKHKDLIGKLRNK